MLMRAGLDWHSDAAKCVSMPLAHAHAHLHAHIDARLPCACPHSTPVPTATCRYNEKKRFDVVVGVFLSSVRAPSDGALFVRKGSHHAERSARLGGQLAKAGSKGALVSEGAARVIADEVHPRPRPTI